jgi:1,4-dihydroxy-2-naphthoate octaprenyltransferase
MNLAVWVQAARPKTLVASLSPACIGLTLALGEGHFHGFLFLMTLATGLLIQIGTNFVNDYCDSAKGVDTADRKGFVRVMAARLIEPPVMQRAIFWVFIGALVTGSYLIAEGGALIAACLVLYILLSVLYTAGPKPLGYLGLGDPLVLLFYGPGSVFITYTLQTQTLSFLPLLVGLSPGALSLAILGINNVRDIEEDRQGGKRTVPVRWGRKLGQYEVCAALLLAFLPLPWLALTHPFVWLAALLIVPALFLARAVLRNQDPYALNPLLEKTAKLLAIFTLLFCIGYLL